MIPIRRFTAAMLIYMVCASNIFAQDSVDVTFRYNIEGFPSGLTVPGEFNGWNNQAWPMIYMGGDLWTHTARIAIRDDGTVPGAWQYKFFYDGVSPWPNDPLNHHVNASDNDNTFIYVKDPTIYHFLPNDRSGPVETSTPTISAYLYPKVGSVVDTSQLSLIIDDSTYSDVGSAYDFTTQQLVYPLSDPLPDGVHTVILDAGTNADTVSFITGDVTPAIADLPVYADHGVTLPSSASGDSTTFRLRVGGTGYVLLRVAPLGQSVLAADPVVMRKDPNTDDFWANVSLADGTYEYLYQTENGTRISDPWGRWSGSEGTRFEVGPAGLTADDYEWQSTDYVRPPLNKVIMYELHVGEYAGGFFGLGAAQAGFLDMIDLLPHLDSLGINAIELMPVNDYGLVGASGHSWGYDLNHYFALEPEYGTPREFKTFVDSAHARGIAIILDVVFNHQNDTGPLWQMQPDIATNPYFKDGNDLRFNEDGLLFFRDMDHWTDETQEIVYESLKMFIDEYRIDGFRYDYTQGVGWNTAEPDYGILGWANKIDTEYNGEIYQIAEHLPESPALIFNSGLTGGWHDSFRDEIFDEARFRSTSLLDFENLVLDLGAYFGNDTPSTPRDYADRTEPVNSTVTHDEQSLIYEMTVYQGVSEADAILRDKLYATFMFTSLGIPMLWQGMEYGEARGWQNDDEKLSYRPVDFSLATTTGGQEHYAYYRPLILQRKYNPALHSGDLRKLFRYNTEKVLVWGFEDIPSNERVMIVANLSASEQTVSDVPWLADGDWYNIHDQSLITVSNSTVSSYTLPRYTAHVYASSPDSVILGIEDEPSSAITRFDLFQNYPNPFNPETTVEFAVPKLAEVEIVVYNILGQPVSTIAKQQYSPGLHQVRWNGRTETGQSASSGIYLIRMRSANFVKTIQTVLMK